MIIDFSLVLFLKLIILHFFCLTFHYFSSGGTTQRLELVRLCLYHIQFILYFLILQHLNLLVVLINHIDKGSPMLSASVSVGCIYFCLFRSTQILEWCQYYLIVLVFKLWRQESVFRDLFGIDSSLRRESAMMSAVPHFIIDL